MEVWKVTNLGGGKEEGSCASNWWPQTRKQVGVGGPCITIIGAIEIFLGIRLWWISYSLLTVSQNLLVILQKLVAKLNVVHIRHILAYQNR